MQITRTTPARLMILHLSQIFFTLARTFIFSLPFSQLFRSQRRLELQTGRFARRLHALARRCSIPTRLGGALGSYRFFILAGSKDNPTLCQVVRRHFDLDLIPGEDADVVHAHLATNVSQYLQVTVIQLHPEASVRQVLNDRALNFNPHLLIGIILALAWLKVSSSQSGVIIAGV